MNIFTNLTTRSNSAFLKMKSLIKRKIPFRYSLSSRTIVIEYAGRREKYMQSRMDAKAFIAYQMIKADLKKAKIKLPSVSSWHVRYYQHDIRQTVKSKKGYYIDIKSAYATILFNDGLISPRSYNYIMNLSKTDRLACVGMLASKKQWFSVDEHGSIHDEGEEVNELSGVFFYAVKRTFEIMDVCKLLIGSGNAILNWVDCVYFRQVNEGVSDAIGYLKEQGLNCHFNEIRDFSTIVFKSKIRIRFKDNGKVKIFHLPISKGFTEQTRIAMNSTRTKSKARL